VGGLEIAGEVYWERGSERASEREEYVIFMGLDVEKIGR
jgi:hypothetical protein